MFEFFFNDKTTQEQFDPIKKKIRIFFHLLQNSWENDNGQKCHWHVNQDIRTAQHHHIPDYLPLEVVTKIGFQTSDQMNQGVQHEDKRQ